jgi:hypothetical protein
MKWWIILVGLVLPLSQGAVASDKSVVTKDLVLRAITAFREDPTSNLGHAARSVIVSFSHDSPDVIIKFTPKNYPISEIKPASEEERLTLLTAFIVGNLDSQLLRGLKKDDAYAGDLQLIQTYRQLQKRNPGLRIQSIDKLAELESQGHLKAYLSSK